VSGLELWPIFRSSNTSREAERAESSRAPELRARQARQGLRAGRLEGLRSGKWRGARAKARGEKVGQGAG